MSRASQRRPGDVGAGAQTERARQAGVILGESEKQIAGSFAEAARCATTKAAGLSTGRGPGRAARRQTMAGRARWGGRVISLANIWGTEMPHLEAKLNELGPEGWDAIHVYNPCNTGITPAVAKRPLTETARGRRPGAYESLG